MRNAIQTIQNYRTRKERKKDETKRKEREKNCIINMFYNNCCSRYSLVNRVEDLRMNGALIPHPFSYSNEKEEGKKNASFFIRFFFSTKLLLLHFASSCISILDSSVFSFLSPSIPMLLNWTVFKRYRCSCTLAIKKMTKKQKRPFKSKINNFN